jgi:hypothetical protein
MNFAEGCPVRAGSSGSCIVWGAQEGKSWLISILLARLAMVTLDQDDYRRAGAQPTESLTLLRDRGERWQIAQTLEVFASLAAAQGRQSEDGQSSLLRSARIFGAAEKLRETLAAPVFLFQRHFNERGVANLRTQLDEGTLAAAWAEGRAMTLDQAVAYALKQMKDFPRPTFAQAQLKTRPNP